MQFINKQKETIKGVIKLTFNQKQNWTNMNIYLLINVVLTRIDDG